MKLTLIFAIIFLVSIFHLNSCTSVRKFPITLLQVSNYWSKFKIQHTKNYESKNEENIRMKHFASNLEFIFTHNQKADAGLKSFKLGINQYADLSDEEYSNQMKLKSSNQNIDWCKSFQSTKSFSDIRSNILAPKIDWRENGKLSPITDQGHCGSCWTFSTIASVESAVAIARNGTPVKLSEQELVDCARGGAYISQGCNGGQMPEGFNYISKNGIASNDSYPYVSGTSGSSPGGQCKERNADPELKPGAIESCVSLSSGNEHELIMALNLQPVSISIDAGSPFFRFYASGVYDDIFCYTDQLNHGVVAVGYDESSIIVRNSWGPKWGDAGYIRMRRGRNLCGIAELASYPIATK